MSSEYPTITKCFLDAVDKFANPRAQMYRLADENKSSGGSGASGARWGFVSAAEMLRRVAGLAKALELAHRIAGNAAFTNYAVTHLLPRIAKSDPAAGFATEALAAAIAQGQDEAKERLKAFLEKRGPKVARS